MTELNEVIRILECFADGSGMLTAKKASELLEGLYQVQLFVNSVKDGKEQLLLALRRLP